jgi:hypothetical protein
MVNILKTDDLCGITGSPPNNLGLIYHVVGGQHVAHPTIKHLKITTMKTKNTLDTSANRLTLRQDLSPDIIMFLNSASEPEIRHLIALSRRETETFEAPVSKDNSQIHMLTAQQREEQETLDNLKPSETDKNSTQIRGTGQLTEKQRNAQAALKRIKPSNPRKVDPNFNSTQVLREIRDNE